MLGVNTRKRGKRSSAPTRRRPPADPVAALPQPSLRGWRGVGGGAAGLIPNPPEWRGTTVQVCGMWPWAVGTAAPNAGVPLGHHLRTQATVAADPITMFQRGLIRNPSLFVLGLTGLGKSTLIRRLVLGNHAYGRIPWVLGDVRPDYVPLIQAIGGDVVRLGDGSGHINPLDVSEAMVAAEQIRTAAVAADDAGDQAEAARLSRVRDGLLSDAASRRLALLTSLIAIQRQRDGDVTEREYNIVVAALRELDRRFNQVSGHIPVLADLLALLREPTQPIRDMAVDRGDDTRYRQLTEDLEVSLLGLSTGGRLGELFSGHSDVRLHRDSPAVIDVSALLDGQDRQLMAAALIAAWNIGFGSVNVGQALADAGLEPQRHYFLVCDELHLVLQAAPGMVDRWDVISRINRALGVGQVLCTHTMKDLNSLPTQADCQRAKGLIERAGMLTMGGLPSGEMPLLREVVRITDAEAGLLSSWNQPEQWDHETGERRPPPGQGNFLLKVGDRPGIQFHVDLTAAELEVNDTNTKWAELSRIRSKTDMADLQGRP